MKYLICSAIFVFAIFPSLALASDAPSATTDLAYLKKTVHNATESQLEERYHDYAAQMADYLEDLPAYKNIWLNFNSFPSKKILPGALPPELMFDPLEINKKFDREIMLKVSKARTARQKLVKITTPEALDYIDQNHEWVLPTELGQIKPPAWAKRASDLDE